MIINSLNLKCIKLSDLSDFKIKIISLENRRGSNKTHNGQPNCSGYNINKLIVNGMSVLEYQDIIRSNFNSDDPQYHLTKHLLWDIKQGNMELYKESLY